MDIKPFRLRAHHCQHLGGRDWRIIAGEVNERSPNFELCPHGSSDHIGSTLEDLHKLNEWDKAEPNGNVHIVATYETGFFVDFDEGSKPDGLFDDCFRVRTPSGSEHAYFWHDTETQTWSNTRENKQIPEENYSVRVDNWFVVGPESVCYNDDNELKTYTIINDRPINPPTEAQREFLRHRVLKRPPSDSKPGKLNHPLAKGFTPEKFLEYYEQKHKQDGASYHVHDKSGPGCPACGHVHKDRNGKVRNWCQSSFYFEKGLPPGFHCFDDECEGIGFKEAHEALIKRTGKKPFKVWAKAEETSELIVVRADTQPWKEQTYLWTPLPRAVLTHFAGQSGAGKSPVTVDVAGRITVGAEWPDQQQNTFGPMSVLMMNMEDDFHRVILPRLAAAGGDERLFHFVQGTSFSKETDDGVKKHEVGVALDRDIDLLFNAAVKIKDLAWIVIDPITNYLGKKKMNSEEDIRSILTPLAAIAQELNIPVTTVGHLNKNEGADPMHRMIGATAFVGVARAIYLFGHDPETSGEYDHVMVPARHPRGLKNGLKYSTAEKAFDHVIEGGAVKRFSPVVINWHGETGATVEDVANPGTQDANGRTAELGEFLKQLLKKGKLSVKTCHNEMKNAGFDPDDKALNISRARRLGKVKSTNAGKNSEWYIGTVESAGPEDTQEVLATQK